MSEIREAVNDALATALVPEGDMLVRWVVCAEVIDQEGDRAVWALAPEGQKAWDSLGLLTYAVQLEQAAAVRDKLEDQ